MSADIDQKKDPSVAADPKLVEEYVRHQLEIDRERDARRSRFQQFKDIVDEYASTASNRIILGATPYETLYLVQRMFDVARKRARIHTGKLARCLTFDREAGTDIVEMYADQRLVSSIVEFLRRNSSARLDILVEEEVDGGVDSHPLLESAKEVAADRLRIYSSCSSQLDNHFITIDDHAYRIELDHVTHRAIANFNDRSQTAGLNAAFDRIISRSERIDK